MHLHAAFLTFKEQVVVAGFLGEGKRRQVKFVQTV